MKSSIVKIIIFFIVVLIPVYSCFGVKIDGVDGGVEWEGSEFLVLINSKDSNNVSFGSVSYIVDDNGFDVCFMIFLSDESVAAYESAGVILTLGSDAILIDVNGNVENPAPDSYHISAAVCIAENDGCYFEVLVGYKLGLPSNISCKVCFIDGEGTHSYHYPFEINNKYFATTTEKVDRYEPVYAVTEKQRTTKPKTTKKSTTKRVTSTVAPTIFDVFATSPRTQEATRAKTTKEVSKTSKRGSKTTKVDDTVKSTFPKSSKKTTEKRDEKTVVYYFEKEIIVSQVYVTSNQNQPVEPVCEVYSEYYAVEGSPINENAAKYNEGVTIFRVVCVIAGLLLGVTAAWVGLNTKKENEEKNEKSSDLNDMPDKKDSEKSEEEKD